LGERGVLREGMGEVDFGAMDGGEGHGGEGHGGEGHGGEYSVISDQYSDYGRERGEGKERIEYPISNKEYPMTKYEAGRQGGREAEGGRIKSKIRRGRGRGGGWG
jgi:hypothetical protein